jgi:hypothetical protein
VDQEVVAELDAGQAMTQLEFCLMLDKEEITNKRRPTPMLGKVPVTSKWCLSRRTTDQIGVRV